jgi:L-rhamnose mutarotase
MKVSRHPRLKPSVEARYEEHHHTVWTEVLAAFCRARITEHVRLFETPISSSLWDALEEERPIPAGVPITAP